MAGGRTFIVSGIHIGPAGNVRTAKFTALNNGGSGPWLGQLGQIFEQGGCFFRLVQWTKGTNTVASVDGGLAYWKDSSDGNYIVTSDTGSAEGGAASIAGGIHQVMATATDDLSYIFIQVGGPQKAVVVAASTVAGDLMTGHASNNNVLTRTAAGGTAPDLLVAYAMSTRGTTTSDSGASVSNSAKVRWILGALLS